MSRPRIESIETVDCSDLVMPGDDAYLIAVRAAGHTGWYGPVSGPVAILLDTCVAPFAIGVPVVDHDNLLIRLHRALGAPLGTLASWAIGALDCAVWDLHGRMEERPVSVLLGSSGDQSAVPAYASWLRLDLGAGFSARMVRRVAGQGWWFTKWSLRPDPQLDVEADAKRLALIVRQVSETVGAPAAFDALWSWDDALMLRFGELVDPAGLVWLEEPLNAYDMARYGALATPRPPLALGERLHLGDDPMPLLGLPALRAFTPDVVGCGGLTAALSMVRQAMAIGVPVYPHGRSLVPAVHLAAAFPDAVAAVEYQVQWEPRRQTLFVDPIQCDAGRALVPEAPGLGLTPRRR
ncbi:mandelate racemase/muconate lactonizing enzyme family protein [Plantactinospora mayteni]|uniref:Mandelate racemase n=1 Tax=Plantactinospora mayteni TaxID=566021 RepID=A0ABQ4EZP8_9ACTN|nr:enolase C-terminal domain-like protein [Plantactinospora mayteni]GIH00117.1 mandelate racemase [Plantactinospora mayteni]